MKLITKKTVNGTDYTVHQYENGVYRLSFDFVHPGTKKLLEHNLLVRPNDKESVNGHFLHTKLISK